MPRISALERGIRTVADDLSALPRHVFTRADLSDLLDTNRQKWGLPPSENPRHFIGFLSDRALLRQIRISSSYGKTAERYLWGEPSVFEIALSLKVGSYLSHATASYLHGLTDDLPKTIYANKEQTLKPRGETTMSQDGIDRAFSNQQRTSQLYYSYNIYKILVLSGMNTSDAGVVTLELPNRHGPIEVLRTTSLERTLIDLAVRPGYSGGPSAVLDAYRRALDKVNVKSIAKLLRQIGYRYPYHQSIGFYLQTAGAQPDSLKPLRALGLKYDFYLAHGLRNASFSDVWRVHIPEGVQ